MTFWLKFLFKKCPECHGRFCNAYAFGDDEQAHSW